MKPRPTSVSPLKDRPLRHPGQSLDEEIQRLLQEDVLSYYAIMVITVVMALLEWWRWYAAMPPQPLIFSVAALGMVLLFIRQGVRVRRHLRRLTLARDGERAVGQYLEALREQGYRVLHDLVGEGFNVDHVLIGPAGVFTVETKTIRKPAKGTPAVIYDGEHVTVSGFTPDRDPIVQAKAQAHWLRDLLQQSTGKAFAVRALVLYPGWFVTLRTEARGLDVLVLNPKALPHFLGKSQARLVTEDVQLVTYHLSRYIRAAA